MANQTLNQIKKQIEGFGQAHGQIATVRFSQAGDALQKGDILYPAFLFTYTGGRKEKNVLQMSFTCWVLDNMLKEAENEAEVWSDTTSIACDLLSQLDGEDDYSLSDGIEIENLDADTGDLTAGVRFKITLVLRFPYDRCIVPTIGAPAAPLGDFNGDFSSDFSGGADGGGNGAGPDFNGDFNNDFNTGAATGKDFNTDFNPDFGK